MTKEEQYIEHKKQNLIRLVDAYNEVAPDDKKFQIIDRNNLDIEKNFCKPQICRYCGRCCVGFPCAFSPNDFLDITDIDYMKNILDTGLICISNVYKTKTLILRPRGYYDRGIVSFHPIIVPDEDNPCIFRSLNCKGCLLPTEYRPSQGLLRIPPNKVGFMMHASPHINMYVMANYEEDYQPYQEVLNYLVSEYKYTSFPINKISPEEDPQKLIKALIRENN